MFGNRKILALVCLLSLFLLGEDVEHRPVMIGPPPADSEKPVPAEHPRTSFGPRKLVLDPQLLMQPPVWAPRELTERELVTSRIEGYFADIAARNRAARGNVDPGWHYLSGRMQHYFEPDFSQVSDPRITEVSGPWLAKTVWDWLGGWYRNASRTAADGSTPLGDDPYLRVDTTMLDMQLAAYADDGYGATVTAIIEINISSAGELKARLFESSGHSRFDAAAMAGVERAIANPSQDDLPPGPARSLYSLSARYVILPPLPVVGFAFDLSLGYFDLMYPLKKMVHGQARLLAVYRMPPVTKKLTDR
ncbi:MAG TPA: energy transducer TonB [Myxococcota bacterium]|nr:energy transducer TonB [Myxococcota bacterium]